MLLKAARLRVAAEIFINSQQLRTGIEKAFRGREEREKKVHQRAGEPSFNQI